MKIYTQDYEVGVGECDLFGRLRCGPLLRFLQHAETAHCMNTSVSREALLSDLNGIWVLSRLKVMLQRPILWKETLTIKTYHRGLQGAMLMRDCLLYVGEELVGKAVSGWLVVDFVQRKILRSSMIEQRIDFRQDPPLMEEARLGKLVSPGALLPAGTREVRYSDLDYNLHLNHTIYGDIACDALHLENRPDEFPAEVQLNFIKETLAGEVLELQTGGEEEHFITGSAGGVKRFDAKILLKKVAE